MSAPSCELLMMLSVGGNRADGLASAICGLVKDGAELGALELRDVAGADGGVRQVKVIPKPWLDRLQRAAEVGAFERLSVEAIVARIIGPPAPDAAQE